MCTHSDSCLRVLTKKSYRALLLLLLDLLVLLAALAAATTVKSARGVEGILLRWQGGCSCCLLFSRHAEIAGLSEERVEREKRLSGALRLRDQRWMDEKMKQEGRTDGLHSTSFSALFELPITRTASSLVWLTTRSQRQSMSRCVTHRLVHRASSQLFNENEGLLDQRRADAYMTASMRR